MLNIDKLQDQVDTCISSSIALFRLEGKHQIRTFYVNLKEVLSAERLSEKMVEQALHFMKFRHLEARMSNINPGELLFEVDLCTVAFNTAQCEQFNAAHEFVPLPEDSRMHLLIDTFVTAAVAHTVNTGEIKIIQFKRNENDFAPQALRKYLVSRRLRFEPNGMTLTIEVDVSKIILTRDQRLAGMVAIGKAISNKSKEVKK